MNSWMIFVLVNIVLALVVSIFGNFATGWVKSAYERSIFSSRQKRIATLIDDFKRIRKYKENPVELGHYLAINLAYGLSNTVLLLLVIGVDVLLVLNVVDTRKSSNFVLSALFVTLIWAANAYTVFRQVYNSMLQIRGFDEYKEKTIFQIIKLGGKPADIDKEEEDMTVAEIEDMYEKIETPKKKQHRR